jgi:hypothetical protein
MAKKTTSVAIKVSFGKRKAGKAKKRLNKHKSVKLRYRGQGR